MLYEITDAIVNRRLTKTRKSAERRGKDFNLDAAYMRNILEQEVCAYSGEKFNAMSGPNSLSLERWDNKKGYIKGNVVPVKAKYNHLRGCLELPALCKAGQVKLDQANNLDRPETLKGKAKMYHETMERLSKNIAARVKTVEALLRKQSSHNLSDLEKIQLDNAVKRINSGTEELKRLEVLTEKEMKKTKTDLRHQVKTAKNASEGYGIIAKALLRFEYMNAHNYVRLKKGLPMLTK